MKCIDYQLKYIGQVGTSQPDTKKICKQSKEISGYYFPAIAVTVLVTGGTVQLPWVIT
jgi:hypothetical protein